VVLLLVAGLFTLSSFSSLGHSAMELWVLSALLLILTNQSVRKRTGTRSSDQNNGSVDDRTYSAMRDFTDLRFTLCQLTYRMRAAYSTRLSPPILPLTWMLLKTNVMWPGLASFGTLEQPLLAVIARRRISVDDTLLVWRCSGGMLIAYHPQCHGVSLNHFTSITNLHACSVLDEQCFHLSSDRCMSYLINKKHTEHLI
jgi:hypothetical protein